MRGGGRERDRGREEERDQDGGEIERELIKSRPFGVNNSRFWVVHPYTMLLLK